MNFKLKSRRGAKEDVLLVKTEDCTDNLSGITALKTSDGKVFPAEKYEDGLLSIATLEKGEELICEGTSNLEDFVKIQVNSKEKSIDVYIRGKKFAEYIFNEKYPKPFLLTVLNSKGDSYTRNGLNCEEHPHQRGVFVGVGDVNGVDFWNENPEKMGLVRHKGIVNIKNGSAYGGFTVKNLWCDQKENPFLDEERSFRFFNQSEKCRYIDVKITFTAAYKDIIFGNTKEAGPLGVRVNEEMRADKGGSFVNSYGAENEEECWGRCASFCNYKGTINGKPYGIAIFDNENNERYPTSWHIRNYGLFAPNNLYFKGGLKIPYHYSLTYNYRIVFYEGEENIGDRFLNYVK